MKYCPHCRKPTLQVDGDCPHCGGNLNLAGVVEEDPEPSYDQLSGLGDHDESSSLELDISPPSARFTPAPGGANSTWSETRTPQAMTAARRPFPPRPNRRGSWQRRNRIPSRWTS